MKVTDKISELESKTESVLEKFFKMESSGGILLIIAAFIAIIMANSPLSSYYLDFLRTPVGLYLGDMELSKSMLHWINDGLMAIFFFLVGLEIKLEILRGELSSRAKALLPILAAIGGMAMPAAIYMFINMGHPEYYDGWAIPAATDIAFALGILALLGSRVPVSLKVLLTAVAVIDDLGGIVIIALFYTDHLSIPALTIASICIAGLLTLNRTGVTRLAPYILVGMILWLAVLKSGVHATMAGVITALFIPLVRQTENGEENIIGRLEHALHPWVAFGILPVFAFANAGVFLRNLTMDDLTSTLPLGIAAGLLIGKQVGIFGVMFLAIKSGICAMPKNANWPQLYAVSILCGVGFTMSLFIGGLAFKDPILEAEMRLGVLSGSFISALMGYALMNIATKKNKLTTKTAE